MKRILPELNFTTKTLTTFTQSSCDGHSLAVKCPINTTIIITSAIYGRSEKRYTSLQTAPGGTPTHFDPIKQCANRKTNHTVKSVGKISASRHRMCVAPFAMQKVIEACQDKRECRIPVSEAFFTNPCPDVVKHLQVTYKCQPSEFLNEVICENDQLSINCHSPDLRIVIFLASYGLQRGNHHPHCSTYDPAVETIQSCQSANATRIVRDRCYGYSTCSVPVKDDLFGNPCLREQKKLLKPDNVLKKYAHVVYSCVTETVLLNEYKHVPPVATGAPMILHSKVRLPFHGISATTAKQAPSGTKAFVRHIGSSTSRFYKSTPLATIIAVEDGKGNFSMMNIFGSYLAAKSQKDKFILYFTVGLCAGLICLLLYLLTRVMNSKSLAKFGNSLYNLITCRCCCCVNAKGQQSKYEGKFETSSSDTSICGANGANNVAGTTSSYSVGRRNDFRNSARSQLKKRYGSSSTTSTTDHNTKSTSPGAEDDTCSSSDRPTGSDSKVGPSSLKSSQLTGPVTTTVASATVTKIKPKLLASISNNLRYNPNLGDPCPNGYNKFDPNYDSFSRFRPFFAANHANKTRNINLNPSAGAQNHPNHNNSQTSACFLPNGSIQSGSYLNGSLAHLANSATFAGHLHNCCEEKHKMGDSDCQGFGHFRHQNSIKHNSITGIRNSSLTGSQDRYSTNCNDGHQILDPSNIVYCPNAQRHNRDINDPSLACYLANPDNNESKLPKQLLHMDPRQPRFCPSNLDNYHVDSNNSTAASNTPIRNNSNHPNSIYIINTESNSGIGVSPSHSSHPNNPIAISQSPNRADLINHNNHLSYHLIDNSNSNNDMSKSDRPKKYHPSSGHVRREPSIPFEFPKPPPSVFPSNLPPPNYYARKQLHFQRTSLTNNKGLDNYESPRTGPFHANGRVLLPNHVEENEHPENFDAFTTSISEF